MARAGTTEGQALWQPGGSEEESRFREGDWHLRLAYDDDEEEEEVEEEEEGEEGEEKKKRRRRTTTTTTTSTRRRRRRVNKAQLAR